MPTVRPSSFTPWPTIRSPTPRATAAIGSLAACSVRADRTTVGTGNPARLWPAVAALALSGCATPAGQAEVAAMAATYRYLFANNASGLGSDAAAYCVGIGTRPGLADPPAALIAALSDVRPEVVPASACRVDARVENAAGEPSLLFNLAPFGCDADAGCLFA